MMMKGTLTQYVQTVKLKTGEPFPAMPGKKDDKTVAFYDLSKTPPELRTVDKADVESMRNNETWKHPPVVREYTAEQVADIVAYVHYAGTGERKKVDPDDVR
jgi:hypothetical protein